MVVGFPKLGATLSIVIQRHLLEANVHLLEDKRLRAGDFGKNLTAEMRYRNGPHKFQRNVTNIAKGDNVCRR